MGYTTVGGEIPENDSALDVVGQFLKLKRTAGKLYGYYGETSKTAIVPYSYGDGVWKYIRNSAETANKWAARLPGDAKVHWDSAYRHFKKVAEGESMLDKTSFDAQFRTWRWGGRPNTAMAEETAARFWDECHRIALAINGLYVVKTKTQLVEESVKETITDLAPKMPWWVKWAGYGILGLIVMNALEKGKK